MGTDMGNMVPTLSLFVLAAFRLLPAIARFTSYTNSILFNKPAVDAIYENLINNQPERVPERTAASGEASDITVSNLTFQFPQTKAPVLENVNLVIPFNKSVAFVGETGAGKTTLADIIIGIYEPESGSVTYSGNIGYIPQQIYLLDSTIRDNIALGIPESEIDDAQVKNVIEKAQLTNFIDSLPAGLNTIVGDRGIRLSGGQRQRIGIARALYSNPDILVLDEATSSLDTDTEKAVMEAIETFRGEKTMLIIAHRLSTIEHCDMVYRVENRNVSREK